MNNLQFISVLTVPASSGQAVFEIKTYDASTNIILTLTATGLNTTDSENAIAKKIYDQFNTLLTNNSANFTAPVYGADTPAAKFRAHRTEHVISIFSESQFSVELLSNTTGNIIYIDNVPIPLTISEAQSLGAIQGQQFKDFDGNNLTNSQIADLLAASFAEFVAYTNNYVVMATYVHEEEGIGDDAIQLGKRPLVSVDIPQIRRPIFLTNIAQETTVSGMFIYIVNRELGWIQYKFAQDILFNYEPFDKGNEIKISYVAGYKSIPLAVKSALLRLTTLYQHDADIDQLEGGTFRVVFSKEKTTITKILGPFAKSYFLPYAP